MLIKKIILIFFESSKLYLSVGALDTIFKGNSMLLSFNNFRSIFFSLSIFLLTTIISIKNYKEDI